MLIQNKTNKAMIVGPFVMQPGDIRSHPPNVAGAFIKQGCELVGAVKSEPAPMVFLDAEKPAEPVKKKTTRKRSTRKD